MPNLVASTWSSKKLGWIVPRPIYKVWWLGPGMSVVEKYIVADNRAMAISKSKRKWGKQMISNSGVGAKILINKGLKRPPYAPPMVDLR